MTAPQMRNKLSVFQILRDAEKSVGVSAGNGSERVGREVGAEAMARYSGYTGHWEAGHGFSGTA